MTGTGHLGCASGRKGSRSGQAVVEYTMVVCMLIASLAILVVFLFAFREYGGRVLALAGSEYP